VASPVADAFAKAADLLAADGPRKGNCLIFPGSDEIVYTGDLHGNRANLARIIQFADLAHHANRRLILQEVIHGGPADAAGADRSVEVLLRAARLKLNFPDHVFFLMGNHDLAQITGGEIAKDGRGLCKAFEQGLDVLFGPDAEEVRSAVHAMLGAMPLAARCENGAFMSHSLPAPNRMGLIDWTILDRPYEQADLRRGGSVYEWTWGRGQTAEQARQIGEQLAAGMFLLGHQPVEGGWELQHDRIVLISSDDGHGAVAVFSAGQPLDAARVPEIMKPIAGL
jgi:hypothetical protein